MCKPLAYYYILHITRCIQMIDFHFVKAYDPCYLYTQSWTFSYKGYLVYGPNFLWYTKMHNVQASVHYLTHCIQRADFHFSDDYGLYYSCTQFRTHSSKCYLLHGLYFHQYLFYIWTKFKLLAYQLTCSTEMDIAISWKPMVRTILISNLGPIAQRSPWGIGPISNYTFV